MTADPLHRREARRRLSATKHARLRGSTWIADFDPLAAPQSVALPKIIRRGRSVGRDSVEPQLANSNRLRSRRFLNHLISTFAPAASIFFFISSASALVTPSLIVFGAPSTSAFASAKPRPGTALRTSLITPILFAPISFKITSKVVFSSAAGAAAPPPPPPAGTAATATGAAALTPHFSSSCFTSPAISSTVRPLSCSTILSVSAILFPQFAAHGSPREIKPESSQAGRVSFSFYCRATAPVAAAGDVPAPQNSYALASVGFPSFCAFAFNNLANDAAGSFNNRTNFVAGDNSNPSNCASKTSRDGKSASTSISFADKTDLSTTPIFSAAIL